MPSRRKLIASIEQHVDRGNELMAQNTAAFEASQEAADRNREAFDRNGEAFDRNGEAFERNLEAFDRNLEAFDRNGKALERNSEVFEDSQKFFADLLVRHDRISQRVVAAINNLSSESQAHTEAILALLDRLPPPNGESPS